MYVHVNGLKIGEVKPGQTAELRFEPRENGKNEVYLEYYIPFGKNPKSKSVEFSAFPQGAVNVVTSLDIGLISITPRIDVTVEKLGKFSANVTGLSLSDKLVERELSSEIVETLPGLKRTYKRSRTVEYTVTITDKQETERIGKLDLKVLAGEIHKKVGSELSKAVRESETVEQSIELDGDKLPKVKLVWVEVFREGSAKVTVNGVEKTMPFSFRENIELRVVKVDK